jgi:hypothetical protein
MLRHLKNINELIIYSAISCGLSWFSRLNPTFFYVVLLARLSVLAYCVYIISGIEGNKIFSYCLGASLLLGIIGGYWDLIEINLTFNAVSIVSNTLLILVVALIGSMLFVSYKGRKL